MKMLPLLSLELRRLLQSRLTWLIAGLTALSPALGLVLYQPAFSETMLSMYLANPAIAGGAAGGVLFGLLSVFELDRVSRSRMDALVDAAVPPLRMAVVRLTALLAAGLLATAVTMLAWLPVTWSLVGSVFDLTDYCLAYLIFMGLTLPLAILAAAAFYQFTCRMDLSLVLFAAFCGLSLTLWADEWQLCWLNPSVWALSDDFSNFRIFRSAAYMRFTWLVALAGFWGLSCLCVRQYAKGPFGSFARSVRRVCRPILVLALLASSVTAYALQPFVDHSNPDLSAMTFSELEYAEGVTCSHRSAQVTPCTDSGSVTGTASYEFQNSSGKSRPSPLPSIRATPSPPSGLTERRFPSGSGIIRSTMRPCWK